MKGLSLSAICLLFVLGIANVSCNNSERQKYVPDCEHFKTEGRVNFRVECNEIELISPASSVTFCVEGNGCLIKVRNESTLHNYIVAELDGNYLFRKKIESGESELSIEFEQGKHIVSIYKATEASIGQIVLLGVECKKLGTPPSAPEKMIEFIGNSITAGLGNDDSETPCDSGLWFDQHNAYMTYGPIVSRQLGVHYTLSSISGIGVYRNWDVEGRPTMPVLYKNLYLNAPKNEPYDFTKYEPDIVSIALGTNDLSSGDGIHERPPFDAGQFVSAYISFIDTVMAIHPDAKIALLSSPMTLGKKDAQLKSYLEQIKQHFDSVSTKQINLFFFDSIVASGCGSHPNIEEQMAMANQLFPFYQNLLNE